MGIGVNSLYNNINSAAIGIDSQALAKVKEQIFNPAKENTVDISKLNLNKFNRVSLGTDLYAERTNGQVALQASKGVTDFDLNLSKAFSANVQYLNSQAAQSLFTSKENTGKVVISVDSVTNTDEKQIVAASSQITETQDTKKDKKGSNPFAFYVPQENKKEAAESESIFTSINIFA